MHLRSEPPSDTWQTTKPGLGLIDRPYDSDAEFDPEHQKTQWERFVHHLDHLNTHGGEKSRYKLIYLIRHGEGFHNVKEAEVGTAEWEVSRRIIGLHDCVCV